MGTFARKSAGVILCKHLPGGTSFQTFFNGICRQKYVMNTYGWKIKIRSRVFHNRNFVIQAKKESPHFAVGYYSESRSRHRDRDDSLKYFHSLPKV